MKKLSYDDVNIVPRYSEISSRSNVDISTELCGHELQLPIIASPMESVVGTTMQNTLMDYGAACGIPRFGDFQEPITPNSIMSVGVDGEIAIASDFNPSVLIDVAHGHHKKVKTTIKKLKDESAIQVIAGNIATPEAAIDLIKWGADAIRVGVGGGSVCTTRMKTGVGVPMISCIRKIKCDIDEKIRFETEYENIMPYEESQYYGIPIIADGGMKTPGDIAKALAAGADAVMLGSMLAGTDEAPGEIIEVDGEKMKKYYGSASREQKGNNNYVEGVSELIPYKGSVRSVLEDIQDGLRSAFSYVGAKNIDEFHNKVELIEVSRNGHKEGTAHI